MVLAGARWIDEFKLDVLSDAIEMPVAPFFPRIGARGATAFFGRAIVGAAGGMRFDFVGRTPNDVGAAAIRTPAGNTGGKVLVGVCDAAIVFFFEGVFAGFRGWITAIEESLYELVALFVGAKAKESVALFLGN